MYTYGQRTFFKRFGSHKETKQILVKVHTRKFFFHWQYLKILDFVRIFFRSIICMYNLVVHHLFLCMLYLYVV